MRILAILVTVFFMQAGLSAQNDWMTLSRVRYTTTFDATLGVEQTIPEFSRAVLDLNEQTITLKGYLVPLEGQKEQSHFMFSAFPYASCFFCGAAGPETIIEVFMANNKTLLYTDEQIALKGVFEVSEVNDQGVFYKLRDAVLQ